MRISLRLFLFAAAALGLLLTATACGGDSPEAEIPTGAPTTAVSEAQAETPPTNTPAPTATLAPTATAVVATPTPAASDTPTATAEPPTPAPTPTIEGWYGFGTYPENMNPLTGEIVEDPAMLDRRPLAIKISNYPEVVRPQSGINNADLVFEHYVEGSVTRWTAVFYGKDAHTVGSVRSARIIDFEIPVMYDAAFGYSGAAIENKLRFAEVDWFDRIVSPDYGHGGFYRKTAPDGVEFWHTMFTDTFRLRAILEERGLEVPPDFQNGMVFSEEPPAGGFAAGQVELGYRGNYATWWYDEGLGRYMRWTDGVRHVDANTDQQLGFTNVVVVYAEHVETDIRETDVGQGANSIEIRIWGEGPASVFRNGQRFDGIWRREDPHDMLTFYTEDGSMPIPLAPGNTWFQLVPLDFDRLYITD